MELGFASYKLQQSPQSCLFSWQLLFVSILATIPFVFIVQKVYLGSPFGAELFIVACEDYLTPRQPLALISSFW